MASWLRTAPSVPLTEAAAMRGIVPFSFRVGVPQTGVAMALRSVWPSDMPITAMAPWAAATETTSGRGIVFTRTIFPATSREAYSLAAPFPMETISPLSPSFGVPTLKETLPGVEVVNWYGAILPRGTPKDIIGRLHGALTGAMSAPEVRTKLAANGFEPNGTTPEQFGAFGENQDPVGTYLGFATNLGQTVLRSESESHFLPADWPTFAQLDA